MIFLKLLIAIIFFTTPFKSCVALDLYGAVQSAIENNYALRSQGYGVTSQELQTKQTRSSLLPNISLTSNLDYNRSRDVSDDQSDNATVSNSYGYRLNLSQSIFNLEDFLQFESAKIDTDISRIRFEKEFYDIVQETAASYFRYLRTMAQIRTTRMELSAAQKRVEQLKRSFELGNVSKTDLLETETERNSIYVRMATFKRDLKVSHRDIERLTLNSQKPSFDIRLSSQVRPVKGDDHSQWWHSFESRNHDIRIAKILKDQAKLEVNREETTFLPTLDLNASYGSNFTDDEQSNIGALTGESQSQAVGLSLNFPIFSGGSRFHSLRQAKIDLKSQAYNHRDARNTAYADMDNIIARINTHVESLDLLQETITSNQESYHHLKRAYQMGLRSLSDLLSSERSLYDSIRQYYETRYDYLIDLTEFHRLNGSLNLAMIKTLSQDMNLLESDMPLTIPTSNHNHSLNREFIVLPSIKPENIGGV